MKDNFNGIRGLGYTLMILPVIAFLYCMFVLNTVGPVEGIAMWAVFILGVWVTGIGTKKAKQDSFSNFGNKSKAIDNNFSEIHQKTIRIVLEHNATKSQILTKEQEQLLVKQLNNEPYIVTENRKSKPEFREKVLEKQHKTTLIIPETETFETVSNANVEVLNTNIKYINYTSSKLDIIDKYPVFRCPKEGSVVRSYRDGKTIRRGFKEESFQKSIQKIFGSEFIVTGNIRLNTGKSTRPYEPDIALIDKSNGSLRIDIEIDEPYAGVTRQPTHCKGDDVMRDNYFVDRGWIVIRFSELQVHAYENECLKFIAEIIKSVNPAFHIPFSLNSYDSVEFENLWDNVQAQKWEKAKYREQYLNHTFKPLVELKITREREFNEQELEEEKLVKPTSIGFAERDSLIGFNLTNAHHRDKRIQFYPEPHIYTIDSNPAPSVSTIISKFFPEFDIEYWAERKSDELGMFPNEVARMWRRKGEEAAQLGTFLHKQIENFLLNQKYVCTEEFNLFEQFVSDHRDIKPFRSEWRIFDEEYHVAGTIDLISKSKSGFEMYDWKRSKKVVNILTGEPIRDNPWQSGIGQLSHTDDTSYNRYCLQQSIYRYILEKNYDLEISKMNLVVLYPDYDKYYKVEVPYLKDSVEYILKALR